MIFDSVVKHGRLVTPFSGIQDVDVAISNGVIAALIGRPNDAEASEIIEGAPHAGAHTYWLCDEHDQIEWEVSPANSPISRDTTNGPIHRTNHCLSEENCLIEGEVVGESSEARYNRVEALIGGNDLGPEELKEIFCDRSDGILSVCRHPEDDQGGSTNAAFIAIPKERKAFACRGPADRGSWIDLTF